MALLPEQYQPEAVLGFAIPGLAACRTLPKA